MTSCKHSSSYSWQFVSSCMAFIIMSLDCSRTPHISWTHFLDWGECIQTTVSHPYVQIWVQLLALTFLSQRTATLLPPKIRTKKTETVLNRSGCLSSAIGLVLTCCSWQHLVECLGICDSEALPKRAISLEILLDNSLLLRNIKMNIKKPLQCKTALK